MHEKEVRTWVGSGQRGIERAQGQTLFLKQSCEHSFIVIVVFVVVTPRWH